MVDDLIRRALTRKVSQRDPRGRERVVVVQPNDRFVLLVKFAIAMTVCLSFIEVVCLIFLRSWNSEIFATITGLIGMVTGVLIGHHT
jgi:hypothetical protein